MPLKNAPKRNIASAIDLLEQDYDSVVGGVRFTELPIKQIQPYHDHRFHLYEGQRLEDMVESIPRCPTCGADGDPCTGQGGLDGG